jgi:hypothetical protein
VKNGGAIYTFYAGDIVIDTQDALALWIVGVDELSLVMDSWDSADNIVAIVCRPESAVGHELIGIRHKDIYPIRRDCLAS